MNNYTVLHLHSQFSNVFTTIDSITNYKDYIKKAKECGMKAIAFSEHGNFMHYVYKKWDTEKEGLKYIHAVEAYVTKDIGNKVRDNYHIVLIAKNWDGVKELNYLLSDKVACNRNDGHFYYAPRITYDELKTTSDNIIIMTACLGGILNSDDKELKKDFVNFLIENKHRSFLEIQHHLVEDQCEYNKLLYKISQRTGLRLIAGTDTHALNDLHIDGRSVLQKSKNIHFDNEDGWDLTFKTYDELIQAYEKQDSLPKDAYLLAIENTNVVADMIEEFTLDTSIKYPKLYDDSENVFKQKIVEGIKKYKHLLKKHNHQDIKNRVNEELDTYKATKSIDFMLLQNYVREWECENGIYCGYSRGSVSGSMIAYILGITQMDSMKFDLNFFRFANPNRVTNFDIDTDYSNKDREKIRKFLFENPKWNASEIITFNTIADKGAIRDVGRAFNMPLDEVSDICKRFDNEGEQLRIQYAELFKYVDLLNGVIVSVGIHPSGVLITDRDLQREVGTCTLATTDYPVSVLNMKELDDLFMVKLDILGLDNMGAINETCKMVNIERKTPDNTDLEDMDVWKSIREDTTGIFQWESDSAQAYLKKFLSDETLNLVKNKIPNFSMIKWFSFGNGLIRPACASYRENVANGEFYDNGLEKLNEFLAPTMGHVTMQEDIMQFLVQFCGYSMAESDTVRRGIAKKKGTEQLIPEIKERFINYTSEKYDVSKEKCEKIIEPFLEVILAASSYAFSWNHSDSYSCIGYINGWLRYYYPLEFLTSSINIFQGKEEKINKLIAYAKKININIKPIKFRYSKSDYNFDKETNTIYQGIASIKFLNSTVANELYELRNNQYESFVDLLIDLTENTSCNSKQTKILITLNFFNEFGNNQMLLDIYEKFADRYKKTHKDKTKIVRIAEVKEFANTVKNEKVKLTDQIECELEHLGYIKTTLPNVPLDYAVVMEVDTKFKNPMISLYRINNGEVDRIKVKLKDYELSPINKFDMIKTIEASMEGRWKKTDKGGWKQDHNDKEPILKKWSFVKFD